MSVKPLFRVHVRDQENADLLPDKVRFEHAGRTQALTKGPFIFELAPSDRATLTIQKSGYHTFRFELTVTGTSSDPTVKVNQGLMMDVPRMITLGKPVGSDGNKRIPFNQMTVVIGKPREVVIVTGLDYQTDHGGGMLFYRLGTRRMHDVRSTLDPSTVVTWFDSETGLRQRWVLGRGTEQIRESGNAKNPWKAGWSRLSSDGQPPTILNPRDDGYPGPGVNGIPEVLNHIADIGAKRPHSLTEFSILSHAWHGGPILYNTNERPEFADGPRSDERDPQDRDARLRKDFTIKNLPRLAEFQQAFAQDAFVKIWGCFATKSFLRVIDAARQAKNDTAKLGVPAEQRSSWFDGSEFDDTRPGLIAYINQSMLKANYMAFLAKTINRPTHGSAPGMGALYKTNKYGVAMYVNRETVPASPDGKREEVKGHKARMRFLENEPTIKAVISDDGYLKYDP